MTEYSLGRLEKVDLREVWNSEADHFTPWLAREENLALLAEVLGLDLELEATEQNVGQFRADIVCKDTVTDTWVLIENQLERTDHTHLGQLMTYAAGLDAVTIAWIAARFTEEHRAALDWLNEITGPDVNFFGLEVELWRIGRSDVAPKFNVVSKPNDWIKTVAASRQSSSRERTETELLHLEYWTAFREYLEDQGTTLRPRKPLPQYWYDFAIGRSDFNLSALTGMRDGYIGVRLVITGPDAKPYYHLLASEGELIEREFGEPLQWDENPDRKQSYIGLYRYDVDPTQHASWAEYHVWLRDKLERLYRVFEPRVRMLDAADYIPDDEMIDDEQIH